MGCEFAWWGWSMARMSPARTRSHSSIDLTHFLILLSPKVPEVCREKQLGVHFVEAPAGEFEKSGVVGACTAAVPLSDVARHRNRCTPNLGGEPEAFLGRKCRCEPVNGESQSVGLLPRNQIAVRAHTCARLQIGSEMSAFGLDLSFHSQNPSIPRFLDPLVPSLHQIHNRAVSMSFRVPIHSRLCRCVSNFAIPSMPTTRV